MGRNGLTCLVGTLVTIAMLLSIGKGGLRGSAFQLLKLVSTDPTFSPNEKTKTALSRSYGIVVGDFSTIIETRRLSARPSGLSEPSVFLFGAIGYCSPNPLVEIFAAKTPPFLTSQSFTACARSRESCMFVAVVPLESV